MSFSQYILDSREQYRQQVRERNLWLLKWRWGYLIILAGAAVALSLASTMDTSSVYRTFLVALCGFGLIFNLGLWIIASSKALPLYGYHVIAFAQVVLDAVLAMIVIYYLGGLESRATVLFAIPILSTGVLFMPVFSYLAAGLCSALYITAIVMAERLHPISYQQEGILAPAVLYTLIFFLLALIVSAYTTRSKANERETSYAELLSLLRHQLHHPSGVIAAIVEMIEHGDTYTKMTPREKEYIRQLRYENHRIHMMITNLLKTAEINQDVEEAKKHWGDVHIMKIITQSATSVATSSRRIKDLDDRLPNQDVVVHGNNEQLQMAFENVIENAFKYSHAGTKVTINYIENKTPVFEIDVEDHGQGISEPNKKRLLKALSELEKPSSQSFDALDTYSMGLGLYISKLIIEQHGGELTLQSKEGHGTKVMIRLRKDMFRKYYGKN